jgi:hypothetical protein
MLEGGKFNNLKILRGLIYGISFSGLSINVLFES